MYLRNWPYGVVKIRIGVTKEHYLINNDMTQWGDRLTVVSVEVTANMSVRYP